MDSWTKAVPDELRRAFYMRIYKWVVAFATWRSIDHAVAAVTTPAKSASKTKDASATGDHHATFTSTIITSSNSTSNRVVVSPPSSRHTGRSDKFSIGHGPSHSSSSSSHHPSPGTAYTTRQARSKVVAHEALKKGKKVRTMYCCSPVHS
jgi:hypothetical protein